MKTWWLHFIDNQDRCIGMDNSGCTLLSAAFAYYSSEYDGIEPPEGTVSVHFEQIEDDE